MDIAVKPIKIKKIQANNRDSKFLIIPSSWMRLIDWDRNTYVRMEVRAGTKEIVISFDHQRESNLDNEMEELDEKTSSIESE